MIIFPKICCRELLGVKLLTFLLSNSPMCQNGGGQANFGNARMNVRAHEVASMMMILMRREDIFTYLQLQVCFPFILAKASFSVCLIQKYFFPSLEFKSKFCHSFENGNQF